MLLLDNQPRSKTARPSGNSAFGLSNMRTG
jgi:hypothetical protein